MLNAVLNAVVVTRQPNYLAWNGRAFSQKVEASLTTKTNFTKNGPGKEDGKHEGQMECLRNEYTEGYNTRNMGKCGVGNSDQKTKPETDKNSGSRSVLLTGAGACRSSVCNLCGMF